MSKASDITKDLVKKKLDVSLFSEEMYVHEWLDSGCLVLNKILGGGFPVGRLTEIYGDTSTGKSLIAAQVVAAAQDDGHIVVMADSEAAISLPIMQAVGVNTDDLIYSQPDTVEEVFNIFQSAIDTKKLKYPNDLMVLIWDSIAATSSNKEMESDYGKAIMGGHAVLISQAMRKMARQISKERICAIFLNQTREKIGVLFGDNEATFGGKAVSFYSSVRLRLKLGQKIKRGKRIIGIDTKADVVKNKVASPFLSATLPIFFGYGIDDTLAAFYYLKDNGMLDVSGAWYTLDIDGKEVRFQKKSWEDIYDKHYDAIADLVEGYDYDDVGVEEED